MTMIAPNTYYRPRWTCGRYNAEKHVAIMYNLLSGYSFFFESYSADVIGQILKVRRDEIIKLESIAEGTNISIESIATFFRDTLFNKGLVIDHLYSDEELTIYRYNISQFKISNRSKHKLSDVKMDDSKMLTSDAEMSYYEVVASPRTITSAMLELTYRCSEKCIHCYNHGATRKDGEISYRAIHDELNLSDYKRIIDDLYSHGLVKVCLTGGDPFANPSVWEIIEYLYNKDIAFDIYTNGQSITQQVNKLGDYFPRLVAVSLYSTNANDHDFITRVNGSCEKSMTVLKQLSALSIPINIKCCIMQPNLHSYYTINDFANKIGAVAQYEVNIRDSNDGDICARQLQLTKEQLSIVLLDTNIADNIISDVNQYKTRICRTDRSSCKTGFDEFCITPEGNFQVCAAFPMPFGNLKKQSIDNIYDNSKLLIDWQTSTIGQFDKCGKYEYCKCCKPCAGLNYIENKDFRKASSISCKMAIERYEILEELSKQRTYLQGSDLLRAIQCLPKEKFKMKRMIKK